MWEKNSWIQSELSGWGMSSVEREREFVDLVIEFLLCTARSSYPRFVIAFGKHKPI